MNTSSRPPFVLIAAFSIACSGGGKKPAEGPVDSAAGASSEQTPSPGPEEPSSELSPRDRLKLQAKKRREECDEVRAAIEAVSARAQFVGINNAGTLKKVAQDIARGAKGLREVSVGDDAVGKARDAYLEVLEAEVAVLNQAAASSGALLREKVKAFEEMEASLEDLIPDIEQACTAPLTE